MIHHCLWKECGIIALVEVFKRFLVVQRNPTVKILNAGFHFSIMDIAQEPVVKQWIKDLLIKQWIKNLSPASVKTYLSIMRSFCKRNRLTPERILEKATNQPKIFLREVLQEDVNKIKGTYRTKQSVMTTIRGFCAYHDAPLPVDRRFNIRNLTTSSKINLTPETLRTMLNHKGLSLRDRSLDVVMYYSFSGLDQIVYINEKCFTQIRTQIDAGITPIKIDIPGRKEKKEQSWYYTLIGTEATKLLKQHLEEANIKKPPIWRSQPVKDGNPISKREIQSLWLELALKCKVAHKTADSNRYGAPIHELRDIARSQWELSPSNKGLAEYMMGHARRVDPYGYTKPWLHDHEWARGEYRRAEPYLNRAYLIVPTESS